MTDGLCGFTAGECSYLYIDMPTVWANWFYLFEADLSLFYSAGKSTDGGKNLWNTKTGTVLKVKHGKKR